MEDASAAVLSGAPPARRGSPSRRARLRALAGVGVFACALASAFSPYLGSDLRREAPAVPRPGGEPGTHPGGPIEALDHRFVVWLVARNAWTLLHRPLEFFEAEPCYPERQALAFGEPGFAFGVVGIPSWLLSRDPVATYDLALPTLVAVWGAAVYLLVRDWTGSGPAALAAALLYALHPISRDEILHPYAWDNGWAALALFFAVRLFERRRWSDALGLAAAFALQLGSSLYATLGVACLGLALAPWLLASGHLRSQRPLQWLAVALCLAAAGAALYGPFLARRAEGGFTPRSYQAYLAWSSLLPGGDYWPGPVLLALAGAGVALRGVPAGRFRHDPRWPLLLGGLLALLVAAGGITTAAFGGVPDAPPRTLFPNLYAWLERILPGLELVRGVSRLYSGALLALGVLAGLGAAALLRLTHPRLRPAAAVALVLAAYVDTLRPASLGLEPRVAFQMTEIAPPPEQIEFFRRLAELGDSGPLAETPLHRKTHLRNNTALLLSAYHHRRTSACRNSFLPPGLGELEATLARLPAPDAVARLRELGFATVVVHHAARSPAQEALRRRFEASASGGDPPLHPLLESGALSAFAIASRRL